MVDPHHDRDVLPFRRRGNNHFLRACRQVAFGFLGIGEQARGLDHDIHSQLFPRQFRRRPCADNFDLCPIDNQHVILGLVGSGLFGTDRASEAALGRIVFQQIGQVVRRHDVSNGHHFKLLASCGANILPHQSLFNHGAENQPTDPPKSINRNFNCHNLSFSRLCPDPM